ncbi:hypothetical protein BHE74_00008614 [Ensete ventricosum]|nr:hypothetical protein BHE74_00008614 [Ensete ventricosum]RZR84016.1 hypothetical protein BHM03_00010746 [Ensete ventricosum]
MVCNFDLYRPVQAVHISPPGYWYADRPLPGSSVKNQSLAVDFGRRRSISTVGGRLKKKSTVGGRLRGEERIPRLRAVLARLPSSPAGCLRAVAARGLLAGAADLDSIQVGCWLGQPRPQSSSSRDLVLDVEQSIITRCCRIDHIALGGSST